MKHDCFNCPHEDCIDGMPVKKEVSIEKQLNDYTYQKYCRNNEHYLKSNRERCRRYKERNREKVYAKNLEWQMNHKEQTNMIKRKHIRKKLLLQGCYSIAGSINWKGKETIVYFSKYRKQINYFGFFGEEYFELTEDEIKWLWITRYEIDGKTKVKTS